MRRCIDAQLDGIEFGNLVMMQRQQWAMDMAMLASHTRVTWAKSSP